MNYELTSAYKPTGDQPEAIAQLTEGVLQGVPAQTLLGVTGSGKTFTIANVIANINNFNVIYLLTSSTATSNMAFANSNAKETDLLITWLFTLTNDNSNYKMASVIGIISFVICALLTLLSYTRMISGDKEEVYQ